MNGAQLQPVLVRYNVRLPMRDGIELSANLWLPAGEGKFPAILEMIPYRKDDWRYAADHQRGHYFAQRGYVFCRLDVRGTGSSQGLALDEYTRAETQDGYEAVEWLAAQPWCSGRVGMWGISYGGFTSIQVAKLQPPHLVAIAPMYATDDRYVDDVHYIGGCLTASELAQYAVSQIAMNAMPPQPEFAGGRWTEQWKERLERTPPWLIEWLKQPVDGPYWRSGSLAPEYDRIRCAILHIGGWMDGYTDPVLRMHEKCVNAPRKSIIGNWVHSLPDSAYPGPHFDWLHELVRFFDFWLKGIDNGVMDEPSFTFFLREYTPPEAFPAQFNGAWRSAATYPIAGTQARPLHLGAGALTPAPWPAAAADATPHRPTLGTRASLCWGAGEAPNGLARDLRPDEALSLTYTSPPLDAPLDIVGCPEAILHLRCTAPVAHLVARLTDVAPDGTSAHVTAGILNLTHRDGHSDPQPLTPGQVYEVTVRLKAAGYRFLAGHCIRLTIASAWWPVIFPSPYAGEIAVHQGPQHPSRLLLPIVTAAAEMGPSPAFKTTPHDLIAVGSGSEDAPVWHIVEDVIEGSVTVKIVGGDATDLPGGRRLATSERIELTAYHHDPAHVRLFNECHYRLSERGFDTHIRTSGTLRSTETDYHLDIELQVMLNGAPFFQKAWLETIPRRLN